MHSRLTFIAAQQHIADLHRAADHNRLMHTATTATSSHAVPASRCSGTSPGSYWREKAPKCSAARLLGG